jgi:hypothetical protein
MLSLKNGRLEMSAQLYQYIYDEPQSELRLWEKLPRHHRKRRRWLGRKSRPVPAIGRRVGNGRAHRLLRVGLLATSACVLRSRDAPCLSGPLDRHRGGGLGPPTLAWPRWYVERSHLSSATRGGPRRHAADAALLRPRPPAGGARLRINGHWCKPAPPAEVSAPTRRAGRRTTRWGAHPPASRLVRKFLCLPWGRTAIN